MEFKLEIAKQEDFKKISEIYKESFSEEPYNENWTNEKALEKINNFSKYCDIYRISIKKEIIGFIIINPNQWLTGEIAFGEEIAIKKNFRDKGIGSEVLNKIFEIYKSKGYKKFMGVSNKKSKAINLYKKIGLESDKENVLISKDL